MDDRELREAHNQYGDAITLCKAASLGDKWGVYAMLSTYSRTDERGDLVLALAFVASNLAGMLAEVTSVENPTMFFDSMMHATRHDDHGKNEP